MRTMPLAALLALGVLVACESPSEQPKIATAPQKSVVEETREVVATVEEIDLAERHVTLLAPDGRRMSMVVDEQVPNLDQVEVGDQVVVRYREELAVQLKEPGMPAKAGEVTASATEAPAGSKPAAEVTRQVATTVTIDAVDSTGPTVSFTGPDGILHMIRVQDPGMQEFARGLKPGDEVDITYSEALAVSIEPAAQ
jgi:translation elongation factor P/translation initiation factor 5A